MSPSYYFPFGANNIAQTQSISYTLTATTASLPAISTARVLTSSYTFTSQSNPTAGSNGTNKTAGECGTSNVVGPTGLQGQTGSKGVDYIGCPPDTIECTALNVSLSANWTNPINGGRGVNYYRVSGSQFHRVCIQIPPGCTSGNTVCPPMLPTSSVTSTFPGIT
jgi:hypothetical protein